MTTTLLDALLHVLGWVGVTIVEEDASSDAALAGHDPEIRADTLMRSELAQARKDEATCVIINLESGFDSFGASASIRD